MDTTNSTLNELLKDFYKNLEIIVRRAVADELKLSRIDNPKRLEVENEFLTADQAAKFLGRKLSTLYKDVHLGNIPFHRSGARKLLFSKSELDAFVKQTKSKSKAIIEDEVSTYLISKNGFK